VIVVDTSVWVELLRETGSRAHRTLRRLMHSPIDLVVTEVVVAEVLAGARTRRDLEDFRDLMHSRILLPLHGLPSYDAAAAIARDCRRRGRPVGSIADCLVAVPAIDADAPLLHCDRHFDPIAEVSLLRVFPLDPA
jgi:predicted nucleic acid-binding protein